MASLNLTPREVKLISAVVARTAINVSISIRAHHHSKCLKHPDMFQAARQDLGSAGDLELYRGTLAAINLRTTLTCAGRLAGDRYRHGHQHLEAGT